MSKVRIVIVGGGAAGLELVRRLAAKLDRKRHDVILVDRNRTHVWKPLLHEVATGSLDASIEEVGYRSHCHRWGYRFFHGMLEGIDRTGRRVLLGPVKDAAGRIVGAEHAIPYDYLVLAYGSVTNTFGTKGVAEHCNFLDSHAQADAFREKLLVQCVAVSRAMMKDPASDARVKVAIVGAGATGVELAAELVNAADALAYYGLEVFDRSRIQIMLIEAGARILPALSEKLAQDATRELEALGVEVRTSTAIQASSPQGLVAATGELIEADMQIWAAGVKGAPIGEGLDGLERSRGEQILVTPTLQTTVDERIFAIGDCASCTMPGDLRAVPPRAQAAHQMADATYRNLRRLMRGQEPQPFTYKDHGSLVSLSRFAAVGSLMGNLVGGRMAIEGRLARIVYVGLYRMHLLAIHGWIKGMTLIILSRVYSMFKPRLKLH